MSDNPETPTPTAPANSGQQWWENELSSVRQEAASRRVELRTANESLAQTQADLQTANTAKDAETQRANKAALDYMKFKVAVEAGVPGEQAAAFAELLQGENEDELKAYAERIKQFGAPAAPPRPYDPSQGQGISNHPHVSNTAEAEFLQMWADLGFTR